MKKKFKMMSKALEMELREHKSSFMVYVILRALVILVMILQIFNRNFENVFLCILTLLLLIVLLLLRVVCVCSLLFLALFFVLILLFLQRLILLCRIFICLLLAKL